MKEIIAIILGIIGAFVFSWFQSLFISRRDQYRNSSFMLTLWKISWWIGGFIVCCGGSYRYFLK
jgi:uncharacterized membrane protein YeaQ/YmgE (transglycosylase-associated protein family)